MKRRVLGIGAATFVAVLPLAVTPLVTWADVPANVSSYDVSGHAAAVHVSGYSSRFPNFASGAVDNRYPLASLSMDGSPASSATGTFEDSGPLGATEYPGAVAYANAHYPDTPDASVDLNDANPGPAPGAPSGFPPQIIPTPLPTAASSNGPRATAHADELAANAFGVYTGTDTTPVQSAWSKITSKLDSAGVLTVKAETFIQSATFGGSGGLVFKGIDVVAQVVYSGGTPTTTQKVTIGSVTANGQPVEVNGDSLSNAQSESVGGLLFKIFLAAPDKKVDESGTHLTVDGLNLYVFQPENSAVGYAQAAQLILGEAQIDAVLQPQATLGLSLGGLELPPSNAGTLGVPVSLPPIASAPITQPVRTNGPTPHFVLAAATRKPLAIAFLAWETLLFSGIAAWVWARKGVGA